MDLYHSMKITNHMYFEHNCDVWILHDELDDLNFHPHWAQPHDTKTLDQLLRSGKKIHTFFSQRMKNIDEDKFPLISRAAH